MFFGLFSATVKSSVVGFEHFLGNKTLSIQHIGGTGHGLERFMCAFLFFFTGHTFVPRGQCSHGFPGVPRSSQELVLQEIRDFAPRGSEREKNEKQEKKLQNIQKCFFSLKNEKNHCSLHFFHFFLRFCAVKVFLRR